MELTWLEGTDIAHLPAFAASLAIGLLIGLERERHPGAKAGLRTFALVALLAAILAYLGDLLGTPWLLIVGLGVVGVMIVAAYGREEAYTEPGTTTVTAHPPAARRDTAGPTSTKSSSSTHSTTPSSGATIAELLEYLKSPEEYARVQAKRELAARNEADVLKQLADWLRKLDPADPLTQHHRLEALWLRGSLRSPDRGLLAQVLSSPAYEPPPDVQSVSVTASSQPPGDAQQAPRGLHGAVAHELPSPA